MKRGVFLSVCLALASLVHAYTVDILPNWDGIPTTEPRAALTLAPRIRNVDSVARRVGIELELPDQWRRLVPDSPQEIRASGEASRIVTIFVPQEARAGDYSIRMNAIDADSEQLLGSLDVRVHVLPHLELRVDSLDGSSHVLAGELIEVPFRVANRSNTALDIVLSLETRSFYPAEFQGAEDGRLSLEPNASARVLATVKTPSVISRVEDFSVDIIATGTPTEEGLSEFGSVRASLRSDVEIIPVTSEEPAPFLTIPAQFDATTSQTFGSEWVGDLDLGLNGGGFLDQNGNHRIDFRLQPSVDMDEPEFGDPNDTYRLNYTGRALAVLLGDNSFDISPLLGMARYGRGAAATYRPGRLGVSGLYYFPPAVGFAESYVGGSVDYTVPNETLPEGYRYRTSLNLVSLVGTDILAGTYHQYVFNQNSQADLDIAAGQAAGYPFVWATTAGGSTVLQGIGLSGVTVYGSPGFPGGLGDQFRVDGSVTAVIEPIGLSLDASSSFQRQNLSLIDPVAPRTVNVGLGGSLPMTGLGLLVQGNWSSRFRRDMMPAPSYQEVANRLSLSGRMTLGDLRLSADAKFDLDRDVIRDATVFGQDYRSSLRWIVSPQTTYSASAAYAARRGASIPTDRDISLRIGADQGWGPVDTLARANFSVSTRGSDIVSLSANIGAGADITVFGNHNVSLGAFLEVDRDRVNTDLTGGFSIGYTAPLGIPVARVRGIGSVEGTAYSAESGEPVENVIVRIADRAVVSGPQGNFRLTSLLPGDYYLGVDTTRLGRGYVVDLPLPVLVPVVSDETTTLDIPIARSASVSGTVSLFAVPDSGESLLTTAHESDSGEYQEEDLIPAGGLSSVVVLMQSDDELRRILTDRNGSFALADMRPGMWRVSIERAQLPRHHRLVQGEFLLDVKPGEDVLLTFQVFPIRRTVTLLSVSDTPIVIELENDTPFEETAETEEATTDPLEATASISDEGSDDAEVGADPYIRERLIRMAEIRYSEPHPDSPRLLGLPWGRPPESVAAILRARLSTDLEEIGTAPASDSVSITSFKADGSFLLGLDGTVVLTFLDLGENAPQKYLVGVLVEIPADANSRSAGQMNLVYEETVALFKSRWMIDHMGREVTATRITSTVTEGDIEVRYVIARDSGTITIEYTDDWFVRAEQSIIEFDL